MSAQNVNVYLQERKIQMHISHSKDTSWDQGRVHDWTSKGRMLSAFILESHSWEIRHTLIVRLSIIGHKHPIHQPTWVTIPTLGEARQADHEL